MQERVTLEIEEYAKQFYHQRFVLQIFSIDETFQSRLTHPYGTIETEVPVDRIIQLKQIFLIPSNMKNFNVQLTIFNTPSKYKKLVKIITSVKEKYHWMRINQLEMLANWFDYTLSL